jgi:hypothetical protein
MTTDHLLPTNNNSLSKVLYAVDKKIVMHFLVFLEHLIQTKVLILNNTNGVGT